MHETRRSKRNWCRMWRSERPEDAGCLEGAAVIQDPRGDLTVEVVPQQPQIAVGAAGQRLGRPAGDWTVSRRARDIERTVQLPDRRRAVDIIPQDARLIVAADGNLYRGPADDRDKHRRIFVGAVGFRHPW